MKKLVHIVFLCGIFLHAYTKDSSSTSRELALALYEIGTIQLGNFTLKSGLSSSFYIDPRRVPSSPALLKSVARAMSDILRELGETDLVCGVPYGALPLATMTSATSGVPLIMLRKAQKKYGAKKLVEGVFKEGQRCVVIEDVTTTGGSLLKAVLDLKKAGLVVTDAIVLVDREQGGRELLSQAGCRLHAVFTLSQLLDLLHAQGVDVEIDRS